MDAKSTTDDGLPVDKIKDAAAVRIDGTASPNSKHVANDILDTASQEAMDAEDFDHGDKDAGKKVSK